MAARVHLLPPAADCAAALADDLLARHRPALPDLTRVTVLLPAPAIGALRAGLARAAGGALLGPRLATLPDFALARGDAGAALGAVDCRLILVDALRGHRRLFAGQDPWRVAEALFSLFEEMTLAGVRVPGTAEELSGELARAYGARPLAALSWEAGRIHALWQAFKTATEGRSPAGTYARALPRALARLSPDEELHLAGCDRLSAVEAAALAPAIAAGAVHVWLHGRLEGRDGAALRGLCRTLGLGPPAAAAPPTPRAALLDAVFAESPELRRRAAAFAGRPVDALPRVTECAGPEHEARCAELAVREAWIGGARSIAVVAPDRRLARRIRALLERAGLPLRDEGGWALSTSRAAASLACWLDCAEQDFHYRPLLDLLKSGFVPAAAPDLVAAFERAIVLGEEIESGLRRFRAQAERVGGLAPLLDALAQAGRRLPRPDRTRTLAEWTEGLAASSRALGLWDAWQGDVAGQALVGQIEGLLASAHRHALSCGWDEFRALLDRQLEQATFVPDGGAGIRLLTLEQAALLSCDALVIAGATRAGLPGTAPADPFFNDSVRGELGLGTWQEHQALALLRFRRALEAAPAVRITFAAEQLGEPALQSPWVDAIETFVAAAGLPSLRDVALADAAGRAAVEIADESAPRPPPVTRPAPVVPEALLPRRWSATAHQSLIDCPYQFFARRCLELRDLEQPDLEPDARDYGERVHTILRAFHEAVEDLPAPFAGPVTAGNREAAAAHLESLAQAAFAGDVDTRILAATWLERFRAIIPTLVDWLAERGADWPRVQSEVPLELALDPRLVLEGRIDRLEHGAAGVCVVDYKSGKAPSATETRGGESVQLLHYALLGEAPGRVEYWDLKNRQRLAVEGDELAALRAAVRDRLVRTVNALRAGAVLPANGDARACEYCDYAGLCRKGTWNA